MKSSIVSRANSKLVHSGPTKEMGSYSGVVKVAYKHNGVTYEKVLTKDKLNSAFQKAKASYAEKL